MVYSREKKQKNRICCKSASALKSCHCTQKSPRSLTETEKCVYDGCNCREDQISSCGGRSHGNNAPKFPNVHTQVVLLTF